MSTHPSAVFIPLLFILLAVNSTQNVHAGGNLNVFLGFKAMDKDDWDPVQSQGEAGWMLDFKGKDWPISIALDFLGSYGEGTGTFNVPGTGPVTGNWESYTSEFNGGVRKYFVSDSKMKPYLGGGLAFISTWLESQTSTYNYVRDTDYGLGLWFSGGVIWSMTKHFNLGFDVRVTGANVTIFGEERKAGGFHSGLVLGYHW